MAAMMPEPSPPVKPPIRCTLCGAPADWVPNERVYGRNYGTSWMIWLCRDPLCGAFVGCHQNTRKPLGTFADKATRQARMKAHRAIDPLWKEGRMNRAQVYKQLSQALGWNVHVGAASIAQCEAIIAAARELA